MIPALALASPRSSPAGCGSPGRTTAGARPPPACAVRRVRHVQEGHADDVGHRDVAGAVAGRGHPDQAVREEVPERHDQARGQELRRLHGHDQAGRVVGQRSRCLPGQRGLRDRPAAGQGAPDPAARLRREGLRLEHAVRQRGDARPAALVERRRHVGHGHAVGRRPEGGGRGRLLQQGDAAAAGPGGAEDVRRLRGTASPRPRARACRRSWSATSTAGRWATSSWCSRPASTIPRRSRDWIYGRSGATFNTPARARPRRWSQQWAQKGYFEDGFNGVSQEDAAARFGKGEGLYFITGPWENQTFAGPLGDGVGFFPLPSLDGAPGAPTTGALSLPFHDQCQVQAPGRGRRLHRLHHRPAAAGVVIQNGDLPAADPGSGAIDPQLVAGGDLAALAGEVQGGHADALPGLGDADDGRHAVRRPPAADAGRMTPAQFAAAVQEDWEKSHS